MARTTEDRCGWPQATAATGFSRQIPPSSERFAPLTLFLFPGRIAQAPLSRARELSPRRDDAATARKSIDPTLQVQPEGAKFPKALPAPPGQRAGVDGGAKGARG